MSNSFHWTSFGRTAQSKYCKGCSGPRGDCGGFHERERTNSPHCSILKTPGWGGGIHLRNTSQISKTIKSEEIIIAFLKIFVFRFSLHIQILQNHTVTPAWCTKTLSHNCRPICCEETLHSWAPCEQAKRCYDIFLYYKKSVSRQRTQCWHSWWLRTQGVSIVIEL